VKTRTSLKASIVIAAALVGAFVRATTADATAPGADGKIAFRTYSRIDSGLQAFCKHRPSSAM
jgi:hypothetical protein